MSCICVIFPLQQSNYADEDGGVGYSSSDTGISIQGGEFIDNIAGNAGGGFALQDNTYFNVRNRKDERKPTDLRPNA